MEIDFSHKMREWDGFSFNYIETAQTLDYATDPQEYGGFSLLDENEKRQIIDLIFGMVRRNIFMDEKDYAFS